MDTPKLLLTTVFKPYGIRDGYAEQLGMQMELFNNQITREQGVHSPRANYWTFPLYFLAENINVPTTVLDFPSWRAFTREMKNGYTHVGFSFIQTNVMKVKRMAEYVRAHHPETKIILGGYGTLLPDIADLVPHDELCHGEGVRWIREYFGEKPDRPVHHPVMHGVVQKHIYGWHSQTDSSAVLFPGLGCPNACFFCSTSAMYSKKYVSILPDGKSVFRACLAAEERLGVTGFAIIDENFLKETARARELLAEMEANDKAYNFALFSSAEVLKELGVDFLVRLGAAVVWIGIESERPLFDKLTNIDVRDLIRTLQENGISVITSSILFLDHHSEEEMDKAIEWAISMKGDYHQFMQLTPLPGTPLFRDFQERGRIQPHFPYMQMSGQQGLNFEHPHFESHEAMEVTRSAFRRYYHANGPGVLNMARTFLRGYRKAKADSERRTAENLSWNPETLRYSPNGAPHEDTFMQTRLAKMKHSALECRPLLLAGQAFAPNAGVRTEVAKTQRLFDEEFGPRSAGMRFKQAFLLLPGLIESIRIGLNRVFKNRDLIRTPPTRRIEYRMNGARATPQP